MRNIGSMRDGARRNVHTFHRPAETEQTDMSCQQVPRLAEDPYTFTETPVATTYFTSSIQKHTPIKSANQLPTNQLKHLSSSIQSNRLSNGTTNGSTTHSRPPHVPIYAKQPVYQQQQHQSPPPPLQPKLSENVAKTASKFKIGKSQAVSASIECPTTTQSDDFRANVTNAASQNNGNAKHSFQSLATHLPPHKHQQSIAAKKQNNLNHSSLTSSLSASAPQKSVPIVSSSLFAPIQSANHVKLLKAHGVENHNASRRSISSPDSESSKSGMHRSANNSNSSSYAIDETSGVVVESSNSSSIKTDCDDDLLSHPTPIRPTNGVGKGKKQAKAAFAKPKAEPKQSIGKKLSISGKIQPTNGKRKRSYSQTSHHEALQRIPARQSTVHQNGDDTDKVLQQTQSVTKVKREWHAPDSISFDFACPYNVTQQEYDVGPCAQAFWFRDIPNENLLTREQRLEMKRDNLRRQATQYAQAQTFRNKRLAKLRLVSVTQALNKFKNERNKNTSMKCSISTCPNNALALTAYCYLHITLNADQKLFHPCTAKFSDNSQCRVPVFDISHELPLCPEHAWKRDNYNRMLQEQKPKKIIRKKMKPAPIVRTPKRNKKKKKQIDEKLDPMSLPPPSTPPPPPPSAPLPLKQQQHPQQHQSQHQKVSTPVDANLSWNHGILSHSDTMHMIMRSPAAMSPSMNHYLSENANMYQYTTTVPSLTKLQQQEMFTVCENSSAYESSEDTGVGGLSESELIGAPDGIEIPLGDTRLLEEHDLNNVLNQLPEDAFNDLFEGVYEVQQNDHYEPTQKEQDELARALEEVDEQVKSLEQMTGSTDFLDSFLGVDDEILVDGTDICTEVLTATSSVKNDIRGLVHT